MVSATLDLLLPFPAVDYHRPLVGTKLYCLVTVVRGYEQLTQSCYPAMERPGVEPVISRLQVQLPTHYTTEPPQVEKMHKTYVSYKQLALM